jgi:hypothetical protein
LLFLSPPPPHSQKRSWVPAAQYQANDGPYPVVEFVGRTPLSFLPRAYRLIPKKKENNILTFDQYVIGQNLEPRVQNDFSIDLINA